MASLLVGAGFLIHEVVQKKKELKREKKQQAFEARYRELEQEQASYKVNNAAASSALPSYEKVMSQRQQKTESQPRTAAAEDQRRNSSESDREEVDGPTQWVDEVVRQRSMSH